jgi:hypothetical protein
MTHQSASAAATHADAGRQIAQLRHVLGLVRQIAGQASAARGDAALEENARISSGYADAPAIAQRRFDALAGETAAWAAAGVQALLAANGDRDPPRAAAAGLADELTGALEQLTRLVR